MAFFTPVFHFGGQCADAMAFYAEALGGKINRRMTYAEADPADCAVQPGTERLIYHGEMELFGQRFMMSDDLDVPYQPSSAMFLNVTFDTKEEVRAAFDALSAGAKAIDPVCAACDGVQLLPQLAGGPVRCAVDADDRADRAIGTKKSRASGENCGCTAFFDADYSMVKK